MKKQTKEDWKIALAKEFRIHFKDSPDEFGFLEAFIDDLLKEVREKWEKEFAIPKVKKVRDFWAKIGKDFVLRKEIEKERIKKDLAFLDEMYKYSQGLLDSGKFDRVKIENLHTMIIDWRYEIKTKLNNIKE